MLSSESSDNPAVTERELAADIARLREQLAALRRSEDDVQKEAEITRSLERVRANLVAMRKGRPRMQGE